MGDARCAGCGGCPSCPGAGVFWPTGGSGGCPAGDWRGACPVGCWAIAPGLSEPTMIAAKIQLRQRELKKFIIVADNVRSERIGVIHDDDVPKVNRKTTARNSADQQFRFSNWLSVSASQPPL